jgi:nucleotide-binding universal stress UspA family protein
MKKILVAVDGSEAASKAAVAAGELARQMGATVTLAYVLVPVAYPTEFGWIPSPDVHEALRTQGQKILSDASERVASAGQKVELRLLEGPAAEAIADAAEVEGFDLVVVGSKGRGAVARLLLGSVASRLLHICKKPILVMR